jgi:hypothetical protein
MERGAPYEEPVVRDYGDLLEVTQAHELDATDDAAVKLAMLELACAETA